MLMIELYFEKYLKRLFCFVLFKIIYVWKFLYGDFMLSFVYLLFIMNLFICIVIENICLNDGEFLFF